MRKSKILIVEDEGIVAKSLERKLCAMGYEVPAIASTGEDAVRKAFATRPDLVLMDIQLKGKLNGIQAAEVIYRELKIPVIYLSAYSDDQTLSRAKFTEPFGYLLKPVSEGALKSTVDVALYKSNLEKELRSTYERLNLALDVSQIGIWDWDIPHDSLIWDKRMYDLYEIDAEKIESVYEMWRAALLPEDLDRAQAEVQDSITHGKIFDTEFRIQTASGTIKFIRAYGKVYRDGAGKPTKMVGANLDISAIKKTEAELVQKKNELAKANQDLSRSNVDLQQFAYVASHDMKEPLRMISIFMEALKSRCHSKLDSEELEYVDAAIDGAIRIQQLIEALLKYSQVANQEIEFEEVELSQIVSRSLENLKSVVADSQAEFEIGPLPKIKGHKIFLTQLFQNLFSNSIKFRSDKTPRIRVSSKGGHHYWQIEVADNGIGISEKFSEQVFTMFHRLHSKDKAPGSGIGLAVCKRIVERHGGRIWAKGKVGVGTTFYIQFPNNLQTSLKPNEKVREMPRPLKIA